MRLHFVGSREDHVSVTALRGLQELGCTTSVVDSGASVESNAIAVFGVEKLPKDRYLRLAKHRMEQEGITIPAWARDTPFCVAVSASALAQYPHGLKVALSHMAQNYADWGPWMRTPDAPWFPRWKGSPHESFAAWKSEAVQAVSSVPCAEKLVHRLSPIFKPTSVDGIKRLVVTGYALFNKPHTDVADLILPDKKRSVVAGLGDIVHDAGVEDIRFIVPRADLLRAELRDHFHPFMFVGVSEVAGFVKGSIESLRIFGKEHAHARTDAEIAASLDRSAGVIEREIVDSVSESTGKALVPTTWSEYIGPFLPDAQRLAEKHIDVAHKIYRERVHTRPSYASLHEWNPERGLKRTLSNNTFYIAEAMYLKENPDVAVVNCEFADTFWKGLEPVLEREVWGDFRPLIGMVPMALRQPWSY